MKVMIVDDHEGIRRMIASYIGDMVDEFVECSDGSQALGTYEKHRPDVVLMDIKMEMTGGFTATRDIVAAFKDAYVVIVSQWDNPLLRLDAHAAGARDFVSKADLSPLRKLLKPKQNGAER